MKNDNDNEKASPDRNANRRAPAQPLITGILHHIHGNSL